MGSRSTSSSFFVSFWSSILTSLLPVTCHDVAVRVTMLREAIVEGLSGVSSTVMVNTPGKQQPSDGHNGE